MSSEVDGQATQTQYGFIHPRWRVLIGAIIVQLILGTIYGYSIFWPPLEELSGASNSNLKLAFSICILSFALVMVIAGRVQDVLGPRIPALVGAVLMGLGFILAGLATFPVVFFLAHASMVGVITLLLMLVAHAWMGKLNREEYPMVQYVPLAIVAATITGGIVLGNRYVGHMGSVDHLLLLWGTIGFLAGAGVGFAYVCPIAALVKWFPQHKGLVSGVAVAGFGFGAYLFKGKTLGALGFIEQHGINNFFLVHGLVCLVAIAIGAMMLSNPPSAAAASKGAASDSESTWQDTLKRPAFYVLWLMYFSGSMAGLMVIGIVATFVKARVELAGFSSEEAITIGATAMGMLAIFNAFGRIFWGLTSDRIGRTAAFIAVFLIQAGVMVALGNMQGKMALYVATSLVGFNYGGCFALFPSATADLFGARNLGVNYGWLFTSYGIAGLVGIVAGNVAKDMTGSYAASFYFAAALCVISAMLAIGLAMTARKQAATA